MANSESPIGIFDSGVGGLTVCRSIRNLLPDENIIYFGDTLRFPYGTRSIDTIIGYAREISSYLMSRDVKMIVIACNTASAAALDVLKKEIPIPVIGVIEAGARAACSRINGDKIGVIATRATVSSGSYKKEIENLCPGTSVFQQQASLFVSLTEEGWIDGEITRLTAREYIEPMYQAGVRTLILGCTHFPLLKHSINSVYPDIDLIDTGEEIAREVAEILKQKYLENKKGKASIELYASDITETILRLEKLFFPGEDSGIQKLIINGKI